MRKILCLFILFPFLTFAQKIALLDTDFKSPIIYTDSVTVHQTVSGLFPVSVNDFDTLYANLEYIKKMLTIRQRSKMKSFELHAGKTKIEVSRVPAANGDKYFILATTFVDDIQSNLRLTDITRTNKKNSQRIEVIMEYLKTNKSLFKKPYGIHPKIYNVVVITD